MNWFIILFAGPTTALLVSAIFFYREARKRVFALEANLATLKREKDKKEEIATELCDYLLTFIDPKTLQEKQDIALDLENDAKTESGRLAIAKAESESLEIRLKELEEVARELEASSLAASQEIEMLKSQERELANKNENLRVELDSSLEQLDQLLDQLSSSQVVVESLNKTKTELLECQEKIIWYQERISEINMNYMQLKKAYDALDIEYAQLYEKQNT